MKTAALIFGLLAGLLGGLALAFGTIEPNLAAVPAFGVHGTLVARLLVYLVPAIGWIGTGMVLARPRLGSLGLLLSAAGWAALAFVAGHGAVLFAAPPFTFAAAAGIVALFARQWAEPEGRRGVSPPAVAAAAPPEPAAQQQPQRRQLPSPLATPQTDAEESFAAPTIPPPFLDEIPDDEPPVGTAPDDDATAPIVAAMEIQSTAVASGTESYAIATPAEPATAITPSPARAADRDAAGLATRRPGEWSLPTPADSATRRYAAERQSPPAGPMISAPLRREEQPGGTAPIRPTPGSEATLPPLAGEPAMAKMAAPIGPPRASATLDFAPADAYGRGGGPLADPASPAEPAGQERRRQRASRALGDAEPESDSTAAPPSRQRAGGVQRLLRGAIAAVFVVALLGVCSAIYLDYLRGPKSILFGQRARETQQSQTASPAPTKKGTTVGAPRRPTPASAPPPGPPVAAAPAATVSTAPVSPTAGVVAVPAPTANVAAAASTSTTTSFSDPVRYCTAVRTIDAPDSRYVGPTVPPVVATALLLPKSAPATQAHWRCADGVALACNAGTADACGLTPTVDYMLQYCAAHPGAGAMPAPNGSWSCTGKRPVIPDNQSWPVDGRGFYPDAWVRVSPIGAG